MRRYALVLGLLVGLALGPSVVQALQQHSIEQPPRPSDVPGIAAAASGRAQSDAVVAGDRGVDTHDDGGQRGDAPAFTDRSARLEDVARRPVRVRIAALDVDARVIAVGTAPDGQLDVPPDGSTVVWYQAGSVPGAAGSAVLAAHVDYAGRPGVFYALDRLAPGETIEVEFDDGATSTFDVEERTRYRKQVLPIDDLFTRNGEAMLTLITCGGQFNETTREYDSNTVVRAALR